MAEVYELLSKEERLRYVIVCFNKAVVIIMPWCCRVEHIEFLDEQELLMQLLQHYCLSCGWNDSTNQG